MEMYKESLDILNEILECKECPFLDNGDEDCDENCPCRMFNNENISCYEIAKKLQKKLNLKK